MNVLVLACFHQPRWLRQGFVCEWFCYCQPCVCVMRGAAATVLVGLRCAAHDASRESCVCLASSALFRLFVQGCLAFHRASWPNMALKGTCRLMAVLKFCNLSSFGFRFTSMSGTPLSSTLDLISPSGDLHDSTRYQRSSSFLQSTHMLGLFLAKYYYIHRIRTLWWRARRYCWIRFWSCWCS